jgi:hypothetical protein
MEWSLTNITEIGWFGETQNGADFRGKTGSTTAGRSYCIITTYTFVSHQRDTIHWTQPTFPFLLPQRSLKEIETFSNHGILRMCGNNAKYSKWVREWYIIKKKEVCTYLYFDSSFQLYRFHSYYLLIILLHRHSPFYCLTRLCTAHKFGKEHIEQSSVTGRHCPIYSKPRNP